MRRILAAVSLILILGCSKISWLAKIYIVKAEKAYDKAHNLRAKKEFYDERLQYYRDACQFFLKAYNYDADVFTLNRIYFAADACLRVEDRESEGKFRQFEEEYIKHHPREAEYGDAGFMIGLE